MDEVVIITSRPGLRARLREIPALAASSSTRGWSLPEALSMPGAEHRALVVDVVDLFGSTLIRPRPSPRGRPL